MSIFISHCDVYYSLAAFKYFTCLLFYCAFKFYDHDHHSITRQNRNSH